MYPPLVPDDIIPMLSN